MSSCGHAEVKGVNYEHLLLLAISSPSRQLTTVHRPARTRNGLEQEYFLIIYLDYWTRRTFRQHLCNRSYIYIYICIYIYIYIYFFFRFSLRITRFRGSLITRLTTNVSAHIARKLFQRFWKVSLMFVAFCRIFRVQNDRVPGHRL
jgi:hypothetical protein